MSDTDKYSYSESEEAPAAAAAHETAASADGVVSPPTPEDSSRRSSSRPSSPHSRKSSSRRSRSSNSEPPRPSRSSGSRSGSKPSHSSGSRSGGAATGARPPERADDHRSPTSSRSRSGSRTSHSSGASPSSRRSSRRSESSGSRSSSSSSGSRSTSSSSSGAAPQPRRTPQPPAGPRPRQEHAAPRRHARGQPTGPPRGGAASPRSARPPPRPAQAPAKRRVHRLGPALYRLLPAAPGGGASAQARLEAHQQLLMSQEQARRREIWLNMEQNWVKRVEARWARCMEHVQNARAVTESDRRMRAEASARVSRRSCARLVGEEAAARERLAGSSFKVRATAALRLQEALRVEAELRRQRLRVDCELLLRAVARIMHQETLGRAELEGAERGGRVHCEGVALLRCKRLSEEAGLASRRKRCAAAREFSPVSSAAVSAAAASLGRRSPPAPSGGATSPREASTQQHGALCSPATENGQAAGAASMPRCFGILEAEQTKKRELLFLVWRAQLQSKVHRRERRALGTAVLHAHGQHQQQLSAAREHHASTLALVECERSGRGGVVHAERNSRGTWERSFRDAAAVLLRHDAALLETVGRRRAARIKARSDLTELRAEELHDGVRRQRLLAADEAASRDRLQRAERSRFVALVREGRNMAVRRLCHKEHAERRAIATRATAIRSEASLVLARARSFDFLVHLTVDGLEARRKEASDAEWFRRRRHLGGSEALRREALARREAASRSCLAEDLAAALEEVRERRRALRRRKPPKKPKPTQGAGRAEPCELPAEVTLRHVAEAARAHFGDGAGRVRPEQLRRLRDDVWISCSEAPASKWDAAYATVSKIRQIPDSAGPRVEDLESLFLRVAPDQELRRRLLTTLLQLRRQRGGSARPAARGTGGRRAARRRAQRSRQPRGPSPTAPSPRSLGTMQPLPCSPTLRAGDARVKRSPRSDAAAIELPVSPMPPAARGEDAPSPGLVLLLTMDGNHPFVDCLASVLRRWCPQ
eukprot:TRINITY_DN17783_c0_g1_i1.p1 TRINITY_DN17783_c0_g1~~TRINITY_DN17783_c0_g1_i1.p1  ORF type:complete len:1024 (+),score=228.19 TRINITY_DN17783_c0_g1_i1:75-3074(+)